MTDSLVSTPEHPTMPGKHGGFLLKGRPPGFQGAGGRPPNWSRAASRESYNKLIEVLDERINEPDKLSVSEITQALNVTGKYGLGEAKVQTPDELIEAVSKVLAEFTWMEGEELRCVPDTEFEAFCRQIQAALSE